MEHRRKSLEVYSNRDYYGPWNNCGAELYTRSVLITNISLMNQKVLPMLSVEYLVLHCSSTRCNQNFTFEDLKRCHRAKGYAFDCGYHWYITRDGQYHEGRPEHVAGAHVRHYNQHAIGICYEGGLDEEGGYADTRTEAQKAAILFLLKDLKRDYPHAKVVGHRDFPGVTKKCPCLEVSKVYGFLNDDLKEE